MTRWGEIKCPKCEALEAENAKIKQMWWDAGDVTDLAGTIADLQAKLRKSALQELSALGQASEAYQAQLEAEAKLAKAVAAMQFWSEAVEPDVDKAITLMASTLAELKGQGNE